jgi:transposase-like protein
LRAYPDEILISTLARVQHSSGIYRMKPTLRTLYANDYKKVSVDLPSSMEELVERTIIDCSLHDALNQHTLLPFYRPFLTKYQVDLISEKMIKGKGSAIHCTSGVMASVVKNDASLRLCPLCIRHDIEKYGEPFWHIHHQLPGVLVCSLHECLLLSHCSVCEERISAGTDSVKELPIHPVFCTNGHDLSAQVRKEENVQLIRLAKGVTTLFEMCKDNRIPFNLRALYVIKLKQMNLCTVNNRIKQKELISRFLALFSHELLHRIGVPEPKGDYNWLSSMLRNSQRSYHPLLHTLLILFIWGEIEGVLTPLIDAPFGIGPWPCLNKVVGHYKKRTIQDVKITRCSDTGKPVGAFRCEECGFHYSRRGPDLRGAEDIYSYGRVKDFGSKWREKVDTLLENEGSVRSIARAVGVDSITITRYMNKKNILPVDRKENNVEKVLRRRRFLNTIHEAVGGAASEIRRENPKDYAWLYRWDRDWLYSVLPPKKKGERSFQRVNWEQRDQETVQLINDTILRLRKRTDKPVRITVSLISRIIGKRALLEKHLNRLPLCQSILNLNVDTKELYQMRKIKWSVYRILETGKPLRKWRILRVAGIRVIHSSLVEEYLNEKIHEEEISFLRAVGTDHCYRGCDNNNDQIVS